MLNYRGRLEDDLCKGTCYWICKRHETEGILCYTVWPNSPVQCIEKSSMVVEVKQWKKGEGGQIPKKLMGKDFKRTSISLVCDKQEMSSLTMVNMIKRGEWHDYNTNLSSSTLRISSLWHRKHVSRMWWCSCSCPL